MKKSTSSNKIDLARLFRKEGFVTPIEDDEISNFEKLSTEELNIPDLPDNLASPLDIISIGHIKASSTPPIESSAATDLARAAREGRIIPGEILEKMKNDRKNAEKA